MICTLVDFGGKRTVTVYVCSQEKKTFYLANPTPSFSLFRPPPLARKLTAAERGPSPPPLLPRMIPGAADVKKEKGKEEGNCHLIPI